MNKLLWKILLILMAAFFLTNAALAQSGYDLRSPDGPIEIRIRAAKEISYDLLLNGRSLLQDCTLSLDVDHKLLGSDARVLKTKERSSNQVLEPVVRQKFARIHEGYNELRLDMDGGYALVFRAFYALA